MIRRWRIASQTVFFLVFLFLLTRTQYNGSDQIDLPVKWLLQIDPLALLSTLLAGGKVVGLMWLALITIALTLVFGRFFCGWICPLGTLLQLAERIPRRSPARLLAANILDRLDDIARPALPAMKRAAKNRYVLRVLEHAIPELKD